MLSRQKNFLFIHIPKTGGNSIQSILQKYSEDQITVEKPYQDGIERFQVRSPELPTRKHSPHRNRSNRRSYQDYYDDELRDFVGQHYADDIAAFGYEFAALTPSATAVR